MSNNNSAQNIWNDFLNTTPHNKRKALPISFYFCNNEKDANECAELVVRGIKKATASALLSYEKAYQENNEPFPKVGDQCIITNWNGQARAIIEITKVETTPYNKITEEFAFIEGEGDKSLKYWKEVHKSFFTEEMKIHNKKFDENMIIVCEYFKTIYVK